MTHEMAWCGECRNLSPARRDELARLEPGQRGFLDKLASALTVARKVKHITRGARGAVALLPTDTGTDQETDKSPVTMRPDMTSVKGEYMRTSRIVNGVPLPRTCALPEK